MSYCGSDSFSNNGFNNESIHSLYIVSESFRPSFRCEYFFFVKAGIIKKNMVSAVAVIFSLFSETIQLISTAKL